MKGVIKYIPWAVRVASLLMLFIYLGNVKDMIDIYNTRVGDAQSAMQATQLSGESIMQMIRHVAVVVTFGLLWIALEINVLRNLEKK